MNAEHGNSSERQRRLEEVLVAYLDDSEIFYEKDLRTLTITAKMSDVRAFGNGQIDEKTMIGRIQVEES